MGEQTNIEWCHKTFNPWEGCTKIGAGCDHCYAETRNNRFHGGNWGTGAPRRRTSEANWKLPLKWNREAAESGGRYRVFCASLADVFDNEVDPQWRADLFQLIQDTPNLDWLLLTKRIGNVKKMLKEYWVHVMQNDFNYEACIWVESWIEGNPPANIWLGSTIVNQEEADRDIPKLLALPAKIHFLSMEPLLGYVNLDSNIGGTRWIGGQRGCSGMHHGKGTDEYPKHEHHHHDDRCNKGIDWVIVGGESGKDARPMHPEWAISLRDQCVSAGVPYLFKQWGSWSPRSSEHIIVNDCPRIRLTDTGENGSDLGAGGDNHVWMQCAGKKIAGRHLEGETWDQYPK